MKKFLLTSCATGLVMTVLAGNSAWAQYSVPSGSTQDVTTTITDSAGTPTSVSVTGGGTVILDGVNSYTGGTTVSGGSTLAVRGNDSAMGATSGALTLGDSTNSGTLLNAAGSSALAVNRNITLNTGGGIIASGSGTIGQTNGTVTLNGQISGSGGLTVSGPNSVVVLTNNTNNYTGTTSVANSGELIISNDAQLGNTQLAGTTGTTNTVNLGDSTHSASLTIAPGTSSFSSARNFNLNAGGGIINGVTTPGGVAVFSGIFSGGGALAINSGTVELTNISNTYVGGTYITGNATLQVTDDTVLGGSQATNVVLGDNGPNSDGVKATSGTLSFVNSAAVTSYRTIVIEDGGGTILTNAAGTVSLTGIISNNGITGTTGGLTVGGNGILELSGTNTYLGDTTVLKGATLAINADNALGAYTSTTNSVTGQVTNTPNANTDGSLNLNTLHLQGGQLEFTAAATILHNITTDAIGSSINTNDNNAVISGNITGSGDITKTGAGVLTLNGNNTYSGGTTITEGALIVGDSAHQTATLNGDVTINGNGTDNLSTTITTTTTTNSAGTSVTTSSTGNAILAGSGTIGGTVINNGGIVAPANTLTVGGYIQNSTAILAPEITPSTTTTSASELKVAGTATIGGGTLSVGYGSGFLRAGQYQIFTASSISGSGFSTVDSGIVPSAGLTANIVQEGNSYYVVLTQKTDLPDHPNVLPSLTQATIDQAQQTTGALLDRLASARSNALADELAVAMTDTHRVRGTSPYGVWVQPMGGTGTRDAGSGVPGYSTTTTGFLMGVDTEWKPGLAIGVALGYVNTSLDEKDGTSTNGSTSTPLLAVYGGWWSGPFAIDGMAAAGMGKIDASRALNLPAAGTTTAISQTASSSHNANQKIAALQASGYWALDGWVVGPQLGAKYVNLRQTSYTETGTDIYNFTVASNSLNSLRPFVSADVSKRFFIGDHWALVPDVKVGFEHEVNNKPAHIDSQTQGDQALWVYNDLLPGADIVHFVGGLKLELDRSEAFYVNYDRQQSSNSSSQLIAGGFRYRL
jgi:outer membrane autotransporter protein